MFSESLKESETSQLPDNLTQLNPELNSVKFLGISDNQVIFSVKYLTQLISLVSRK